MKIFAILGASLAFGAGAASAAATDFDAFLGGLERCEPSADFNAFHKAIFDRYNNDFSSGPRPAVTRRNVPVPIPASVRAGVGPAKPVNNGEYTDVTIPLDGTFRGLALRSLVITLGNDNGIQMALVRFRASRQEVEQRFRTAITETTEAFRKSDHNWFVDLDRAGGAAIVCNRSN